MIHRLDRTVLLDRRQHHLPHLGQHLLVRPGCDTDKVQQRLMLCRRPRRSRPRSHRLHALALAWQHQPGAIITQRANPIGVTNHARKPLHISRKPRLAVVAVIEIHLALHPCQILNLLNYLILSRNGRDLLTQYN
jgi:hypothetical protein